MSNKKPDDLWAETTFEGSRRAHIKEALKLTIRERLEAMDRLNALSEKMQGMRRTDLNRRLKKER